MQGGLGGAGLPSQLLAAALTEGKHGSEETVQVPGALVFCGPAWHSSEPLHPIQPEFSSCCFSRRTRLEQPKLVQQCLTLETAVRQQDGGPQTTTGLQKQNGREMP